MWALFQGKWKSSQRVRQGKGGFLGQPEMLSHWSSSVLREGWENKTRQVGQCKSTTIWRETEENGKCVRVKKEEGTKFCMEEEGSQQHFWALSAYKGRRALESSAADVLCLQRLLLFCWTSWIFLTGYPRIETAYGLPVHLILRTAAKRKLHRRNGFPQISKKGDLVHSHLYSFHFHELLAGIAGPRLSVLLAADLFAEYPILKQYAT